MPRSRFVSALAGAGFSALLLAGCGGDKIGEFGLERLIEAESGEDVDFDFSEGGFSVSTDEGDFSVDFDEDGNFSFDSDEGSGQGSFGESGITFDTDEGSGSVNFDESGGISFDTDEGSGIFGVGEVPADWPDAIGVPATAEPGTSVFSSFDLEGSRQQSGIFQHDPGEDFAGAVSGRLQSIGYTIVQDDLFSGTHSVILTNGPTQVLVNTDPGGQSVVAITPTQ